MASSPSFEDLAFNHVQLNNHLAARQAAANIESSRANTTVVRQWIKSVDRWIFQSNGHDMRDIDDDIIARSKALDFLASTLKVISKDVLKADQIKLLVGFFTTLFSNDHKAGVEAATKALRQLVSMRNFQPSAGSDIITGITQLGDDFKRQVSSTRLEVYSLILTLITDQLVAGELSYKHGSTCGFMTGLVEMCGNERDPQNLMKWLQITKVFLQTFFPEKEVVEEVFKTFSAYFPITLRTSSTPLDVTVEDLKGAVRSCFAAHFQLADLSIPYLINKLDNGGTVTVAVKDDILQTLEACLAQYSNVKKVIVPHAAKIWSSLKYEVRNGDVIESVRATVKVISTLASRLDEQDLQAFFAMAWVDLSDDLANATYTSQGGKLLTAIAGASPQAFSFSAKFALAHVQSILRRTNDTSYQTELLAVLNSLLSVRSLMVDLNGSAGLLHDELFGDSLFEDSYASLWRGLEQNKDMDANTRVNLSSKLMEGMALLVTQSDSSATSRRLCSSVVCKQVFSWLGELPIVDALESPGRDLGEYQLAIRYQAVETLKKAAPYYPTGYQQLLQQFLSSLPKAIEKADKLSVGSESISYVTKSLTSIGCEVKSIGPCPLTNFVFLVNGLLNGLHLVLQKSPVYWTVMIDAMHSSILCGFDGLIDPLGNEENSSEAPEAFSTVDGMPDIDLRQRGDFERTEAYLNSLKWDDKTTRQFFADYCLIVVSQIYRRLTAIKPGSEGKSWTVGLGADFANLPNAEVTEKEDGALYQAGLLGTAATRLLTAEAQKKRGLAQEAFTMFQKPRTLEDGSEFPNVILDLNTLPIGSPTDRFRTAPLTMGILQGLWPAAISPLYSSGTLPSLVNTLTSLDVRLSSHVRLALNTSLMVLSNKYYPTKPKGTVDNWRQMLDLLIASYRTVLGRTLAGTDGDICLNVFKTLLYFLAGDLARFRPGDVQAATLLRMICATAPVEETMGRQLAQCFELMVSQPQCLNKENHAFLKPLRGQWIYHQVALPSLEDCIPRVAGNDRDNRRALNRAVSVFAIIKHLNYSIYREDNEIIIRIIIRSLTTFGTISKGMDGVMHVLLLILANDPAELADHVKPLVDNVLAVYKMARNVNDSLEFSAGKVIDKRARKDAAMCRLQGLQFLTKLMDLPPHKVYPYRMEVMRGIELACGDPVRAVREAAYRGRSLWGKLI